MGPNFFHVVLYEYLRVCLNTPFKNSTLYEMKKIFMILQLSSQENPQRTKKVPKNKIQNQKWFQKCDLEPFLVQ